MKGKGNQSDIVSPDNLVEKTQSGLISDANALSRMFRIRSRAKIEKKINSDEVDNFIASGWTIVKRHKRNKLSVEKEKDHEQALEDRIWSLLYRMGYPVLSQERFQVFLKSYKDGGSHKKISVFAKDSETVLVIECRAREKRGRRAFHQDLANTKSSQGEIADVVRTLFGRNQKLKIVWIYATDNIIWSEHDIDRASEIGVRIVTENELQYYEAFIGHIGAAGRYQFLAEFLRGQKIPELANVKVPAVKGTIGGETYYSFVTTPRHLLKIAFVNHLALNHPDGRPAYQRMINKGRLKKIGAFVERGGVFPTNLLVNFTEKCRFDLISNKETSEESVRFGWLHLPDKYKSAWVIDGQHRLYGFSNINDKHLDQNLFVLAFERLETKKEAELFITINHEQKSVPRQILVALQADLKWGSADPKERIGALGSALTKSLNADSTGVLFRRFTMEGSAEGDEQSLTIAEIVKGIEQTKLLGKVSQGQFVPGLLSDATDQKTILRARRVFNGYFERLHSLNPQRWNAGRAGHTCVNPGIRAHLRVIAECLEQFRSSGICDPEKETETSLISKLTKQVEPFFSWLQRATDAEVAERFSRRFGEGGVKEYFFEICKIISEKHPDFGPDDFKEHKKRSNDMRLVQADRDVIETTRRITDYVIRTLKHVHGEKRMPSGELGFWDIGIESLKARESAYKRQQEEPNVEQRMPKEAYLDILDIRDIVKQKNNWDAFKDVFNVPLPGEKGKVYFLKWMEDFNKLRRIPAHGSSIRLYSEDDYKFLEWLKEEFLTRLPTSDK